MNKEDKTSSIPHNFIKSPLYLLMLLKFLINEVKSPVRIIIIPCPKENVRSISAA